jgi:membrane protein implicated in regulation of membrane protease activity
MKTLKFLTWLAIAIIILSALVLILSSPTTENFIGVVVSAVMVGVAVFIFRFFASRRW